MTVCQMCKHYKAATKSCGTLGVPTVVEDDGYSARLCGCFMPVKTKLKASKCPLDHWNWVIAPDEIDQLRSVLQSVKDRLSGTEIIELTNLWSRLSGVNRTPTSCGSCAREMVADLQNMLAEVDRQEHAVRVAPKPRGRKKIQG